MKATAYDWEWIIISKLLLKTEYASTRMVTLYKWGIQLKI